MKSLNIDVLKNYWNKYYPNESLPNIFIETGTYKGGTIIPLSKYFKQLYTIELNENSYNYTKNVASTQGITNINFYNGESESILPNLIKNELINYNKIIFFLDAHVTISRKTKLFTSKGSTDVPVCLELEIIASNYKNECLIIIDDTTNFGKTSSEETAHADWSLINNATINKSLKNRLYIMNYTSGARDIPNDRILIRLLPKF